jgi:hypothetical protein
MKACACRTVRRLDGEQTRRCYVEYQRKLNSWDRQQDSARMNTVKLFDGAGDGAKARLRGWCGEVGVIQEHEPHVQQYKLSCQKVQRIRRLSVRPWCSSSYATYPLIAAGPGAGCLWRGFRQSPTWGCVRLRDRRQTLSDTYEQQRDAR